MKIISENMAAETEIERDHERVFSRLTIGEIL